MSDSTTTTLGPAPSGSKVRPPEGMPSFDRTRSGYDTGQVHHYVNELLTYARRLETRIAGLGKDAVTEVVHEAESPQGQRMIADLMRIALEEIEGQRAAADADIARLLEDARREASEKTQAATKQATSIIDGAQAEASKLVSGAQEQSSTVLATARAQAKQMLDDASAHAAAVHEGAERRLTALTSLHQETTRRLAEIHSVTGQTLNADSERGSLADEVTRATSALAAQPQLPAELPAAS